MKDARDLFCLCCFTGMSMSDALAFNPQKHVKERDGRYFIVFSRQKTGSSCEIPVISQAKSIIESREWPVKLNKRAFQYQVANLGDAIGRELNTHMGRKTFGALMLEFGFSIEAVSNMMGHKSIVLTSKTYAPITSKKITNEMDRVANLGLVAFM